MAEPSVKKAPFALKPVLTIQTVRDRMHGFLSICIPVLLIALILGCSKANPEIVGIWDNIKAPESVEFKPDGTGVFTYRDSGNPPLTFAWKQVVKNSYILDVNFMGNRKNLTATIHSSTLGIESTTGEELYQRHTSQK